MNNKRQIILLAIVFCFAFLWLIINLISDYNPNTLVLLIITIVIFGGGTIFVLYNMLEHYRNSRYAKSLAEKGVLNPFEESIIKAVDGKLNDIIKQHLKEQDIRNMQAIDSVFYKKMVCITYDYKKYNVLFDISEDSIIYNIYEPEHYLTKLGKNEVFLDLNKDHHLSISAKDSLSLNEFFKSLILEVKRINKEIEEFEKKVHNLEEPAYYKILHKNTVKKNKYWLNIIISTIVLLGAVGLEFLGYKAIINIEEFTMLYIITSIFKVIGIAILLDIPHTVESKEIYRQRNKRRLGLSIGILVYTIINIVLAFVAKNSFVTDCTILYLSILGVYIIISLPKYLNTDEYNDDYKFLIKKIYDKKFSGKIYLNNLEENQYEIKNETKSLKFNDEQLPKEYLYRVIKNMLTELIYETKNKYKFYYYEVEADNIILVIDGKEIYLVKNHKLNIFKFFFTHYKKSK